ncbi:hypothetical protein J6590_063226 [Homalodisca vitripennis]|nr:hypothetical protein J6590_063226 [Homalodisca vitripennis]
MPTINGQIEQSGEDCLNKQSIIPACAGPLRVRISLSIVRRFPDFKAAWYTSCQLEDLKYLPSYHDKNEVASFQPLSRGRASYRITIVHIRQTLIPLAISAGFLSHHDSSHRADTDPTGHQCRFLIASR